MVLIMTKRNMYIVYYVAQSLYFSREYLQCKKICTAKLRICWQAEYVTSKFDSSKLTFKFFFPLKGGRLKFYAFYLHELIDAIQYRTRTAQYREIATFPGKALLQGEAL